MSQETEAKAIEEAYRAYCDACQSNHLDQVPAFWALPAQFTLDTGGPETTQQLVSTPDEMIKLYSTLFGDSTGVDKTVIDSSEVVFYGDRLATIATKLRHLAGDKLNDRQDAVYGCRKTNGKWLFCSHLSVDLTD